MSTFTDVTVAWIFFRANSITDALLYIGKINTLKVDAISFINAYDWLLVITLFVLDFVVYKKIKIKMIIWLIMIIAIIGSLNRELQSEFIYFQF